MGEIVSELLVFARAEERTRLAELVRRLLGIQRIACGRGVVFRERLLWEGEAEVAAAKVEQILTNLLSNAVDAVPDGDGEIEVEVRADVDDVLVEVRDDGPGVDAAVAAHVFDAFMTTKPKGEGTGLGLAISRRLARAMGGDLTLVARASSGAAFRLSLPIRQPVVSVPPMITSVVPS